MKSSVSITIGIAVSGLVLAAISRVALSSAAPSPGATASAPAPSASVERGKHLVLTTGCNDCHTPWKLGQNGPEPDMTRMLSGHPEQMLLPAAPKGSGPWLMTAAATNTAWAGPWGVSHTANLTPDPETGLGAWTEDNFVQTIKTGRHMGRGREILPPMPIPAYSNFTLDELRSIFAYLRTIPAVKNRVPDPLPPPATAE